MPKLIKERPHEPHWSTMWMPKIVEIMQGIHNHTRPSEMADHWKAQTYALPTGRSQQVAQRNPQRRHTTIWAEPANTTPVWVSSAAMNGTDPPNPNGGAIPLAVGTSAPLELYNCGDIYAWSATNGLVYVIEEYAAP